MRLKPGPADRSVPGVGWIGAGAFSTGTLLPAFRDAGFERFVAVATASGVSARRAAERHGFEKAVSGAAAVIDDPDVSLVVIATPHDVHEELASRALAAGRDVWCEKPLALTCAGVDEVEKAWRESGRQLTLGFNRRWAPAVLAAQRVLAEVQAPKLVVYRIAAGRVPDGHWYLDRRQGGRLLGEVCHFVDLAQALVGADIEDAVGVLGGDASQGNDGVVVALRFADGSVASIAYGSTPPVAGKERIEVLAGSHQVIIDDFRSVLVNGRTLWKGRQDKGHRAHASRVPAGGAGRHGYADRGDAGHHARHHPGRGQGPGIMTAGRLRRRCPAGETRRAGRPGRGSPAPFRGQGGDLAGEVRSGWTAGRPPGQPVRRRQPVRAGRGPSPRPGVRHRGTHPGPGGCRAPGGRM